MMMPGRKYSAGSGYRYGYNGKENDNEVKGEGNMQDYGARISDPRIGRFWTVDLLTKEYPELTPYQYASNRPVDGIDIDGLEFMKCTTCVEKIQPMIKPVPASSITILNPHKEQEVLMADIFGNGHIGPKSVVVSNVAIIKEKYYNAVADNIAGGPIGAGSYMFGGERASFYGAAGDQIVTSFGGISGENYFMPKTYRPPSSTNFSTSTNLSTTKVELAPLNLTINLKPSWDKEQVQDAYNKAQSITNSPDVKVNRPNTENRPSNLRQKFVAAGGQIKKSQDVDHTQDLILNGNPGANGKTNLQGTNSSVNRSFGKQFEIQLKAIPDNTRVSGVYINPFGTKR